MALKKYQQLGVRPGRLRRASQARLERAKSVLSEVAVLWGEIDSSVDFDVTLIIEKIDELNKGTLYEALELLMEPVE